MTKALWDFTWFAGSLAGVVFLFRVISASERARRRQRDAEVDQTIRKLCSASHVVTFDEDGHPCGAIPIRTTELHPAWCFACDACGRDTFVRAHSPCSLEGVIPDDMDLGDFEGGEWISKPTQVTCEHCGLMSAVEEEG